MGDKNPKSKLKEQKKKSDIKDKAQLKAQADRDAKTKSPNDSKGKK